MTNQLTINLIFSTFHIVAHINLEEGFNVVNGSVVANQDPKSVRVNLFGKTNPSSKLVPPLKVKLNFRKKKSQER